MTESAYKAVIECMDQNARSTEWALSAALDGSEAIIARLEAENDELRQRLALIEARVAWLFAA